jgi:UDP-N-acetylmuramate dehydrogenase
MEESKIKKLCNYPISKLITFQHTGNIKKLLLIEQLEDLSELNNIKNKFHIIGNGSNSLIHATAENTPFVKISPLFEPFKFKPPLITIGAGVQVNQLLKFSQENNISAFEFMAGVPASVGGMVAMNFGCWNKEVSDIIESVDVFSFEQGIFTLTNKDCKFNYRTSIFQEKNWIILKATFKINIIQETHLIKNKIQHYVKERVEKQPIRKKTFGSIFKNPNSNTAAKLIEQAGLKGYIKDNVAISAQHANFMENLNNGSAQNSIDMLNFVIEKIYKQFKIKLKPEVVIFYD